MLKIIFAVRIFHIQITIIYQNLLNRHPPSLSLMKMWSERDYIKLQAFAAKWYGYHDPHCVYNPLFYNIGFYNVQHHRFCKAPCIKDEMMPTLGKNTVQ